MKSNQINDENYKKINDIIGRFSLQLYDTRLDNLRLFFLLTEDMYWLFQDFYEGKSSGISEKEFCSYTIETCPFLKENVEDFESCYSKFKIYKKKIPKIGAILLNATYTKVLIVSNLENTYFVFPRGKINEGETELECAIREVNEEIGYDISKKIMSQVI